MQIDVKVSETLEALLFAPRDKGDMNKLRSAISKLPGIQFRKSIGGIYVQSLNVSNLQFDENEFKINWSDEALRYIENRKKVKQNSERIIQTIKNIRHKGVSEASKYLKKQEDLQVLDDHQIVNVACMTLEDGYGLCVFDEQGAGKTVTLLFAFDILVERDEVDFALIIAPKSMISEWPVDFDRFLPKRYKVQTLIGASDEKRRVISSKSDVIITNFETVISMEQEIKALLKRYNSRCMLVVDESFFVKNMDAQRTKSIRRLREYCSRAFVLCGTPAPNSPIDVIQQFNIVDFGNTFEGVVIPKDKTEVARVVQNTIDKQGPFVRHLKKEVLPNLPDKKFDKLIIPLNSQQLELYNKISNDLVADLKVIDNSEFEKKRLSFLARRSKLLQICSNPTSVDKSYDEIPAKILVLDKMLEQLIEKQNEKIVLWSFYTNSIDFLMYRYSKYSPVRYDGTISEISERRSSVKKFKEDKTTMLFIGNPAAAGAGLNLQTARIAIYESMSNQAAHYLQSLDRIHRRGQEREVLYKILLCKNTIEIKEFDRLIQKEKSAQEILGDPSIEQITREMLLEELTTL